MRIMDAKKNKKIKKIIDTNPMLMTVRTICTL